VIGYVGNKQPATKTNTICATIENSPNLIEKKHLLPVTTYEFTVPSNGDNNVWYYALARFYVPPTLAGQPKRSKNPLGLCIKKGPLQ
jgi:hypothetical protein